VLKLLKKIDMFREVWYIYLGRSRVA